MENKERTFTVDLNIVVEEPCSLIRDDIKDLIEKAIKNSTWGNGHRYKAVEIMRVEEV